MMFFLLLSVTALVGCNGLWDFDDDDDVVAVPTTFSVKGSIVPPANTLSPAVKAAVTGGDFNIKAYQTDKTTGAESLIATQDFKVNTDGTFEGTFSSFPQYFFLEAVTPNGTMKLRLVLGTKLLTTSNASLDNQKIDSESTTKAYLIKNTFETTKTLGEPADIIQAEVDSIKSDIEKALAGSGDLFDTSTANDNLTIKMTDFVIANSSPLNLTLNQTVALTITPTPTYATEKTVTWAVKSGGEFITLDGANVTGKAEGTAVVTATAKVVDPADTSKTATIDKSIDLTIKVTKVIVPVTSVTITGGKASIEVDESITLGTTIVPNDATNKTVAWTKTGADANLTLTDNSDGTATIKGIAVTTTPITITATVDGKTNEITVSVVAKTIQPKTITLTNPLTTDSSAFAIMITNFGNADLSALKTEIAVDGDAKSPYAIIYDSSSSDATSVFLLPDPVQVGPNLVGFTINSLTFSGAEIPDTATIAVTNNGNVVQSF